MRMKLIILFITTLHIMEVCAHDEQRTGVFMGNKIIHDYISFYGSLHPQNPTSCFWFEDTDTYKMVVRFINTLIEPQSTDTIFFIREHGVWNDALYVLSGDTMLGLNVKYKEKYRIFEVEKMPFYTDFTDKYMMDTRWRN